MVRLEGITQTYPNGKGGEKAVLSDVGLTFPSTGMVVILGPSGSGKSTLLRLIGLLESPTSGKLYYGDLDIASLSEKEKDTLRNTTVSTIFQSHNLIPYLSGSENIALPEIMKHREGEETQSPNDPHLEEVGHSLPKTLSGGEAQRFAIYRAIGLGQKLILADEPTSSLDEENARGVMDRLKEISRDALVIFVTHDETLAQNYADYTVRLSKGKIVSSDLPESEKVEPFNRPKSRKTRLSSLFSLPFKRVTRNKVHYLALLACFLLSISGVAFSFSFLEGANKTLSQIEQEQLSSVPITVENVYLDYASSFLGGGLGGNLYPSDDYIRLGEKEQTSYHVNRLNEEYVSYVRNGIDASRLSFSSFPTAPIVGLDASGTPKVYFAGGENDSLEWLSALMDGPTLFREMNLNPSDFSASYEPIAGRLPSNSQEAILVINRQHRISSAMAEALGKGTEPFRYEEVLGKQYRFLNNDEYYVKAGATRSVTGRFFRSKESLEAEGLRADHVLSYLTASLTAYQAGDTEASKAQKALAARYFETEPSTHDLSYFVPSTSPTYLNGLLTSPSPLKTEIVGVFHAKKETVLDILPSGIYFSSELAAVLASQNQSSAFANEVRYHLTFDASAPLSFLPEVYQIVDSCRKEEGSIVDQLSAIYTHFNVRKSAGIDHEISSISIRPTTLEQAKSIRAYLDAYNQGKSEVDQVYYVDAAASINDIYGMFFSLFKTVMRAIVILILVTNMLITFLVTKLEVERRKKEIAIFRSMGASKGYTTGLFIMEQAWVALFASVFAFALVYGSMPFVNIAIDGAMSNISMPSFASLPFPLALACFGIAIGITVLASLFPAILGNRKIASNLQQTD